MITTKQLAELFENDLNAELNNPEIKFKIWAEAGEYKRPVRDGNTIVHEILGNLSVSTSANDAADIVMGVNGLSLDFKIPIKPPRTNATQTAEELQKIKDGQYPFLQYIVNAINGYFQSAKSVFITDGSGDEYSVSFQAGTAITGNVELAACYGQNVDFNVYIEVYFIKGGVNSKDVKILFDGQIVPYQSIRYGRAPMLEQDVGAGNLVSKSIVTSTAYSVDLVFPANNDKATRSVINYLLSGEPNVARFVTVKLGSINEEIYLMTLNTVQTSSQGITVTGLTVSLIEVTDSIDAISVPSGYQLGKFMFNTSDAASVTITASIDCLAYISGSVVKLTAGEATAVKIDSTAFEYDNANDKYSVLVITDKAVNLTAAGADFEIIKEASSGEK